MNRLGRVQKEKLLQFRNITGASDKVAVECLKQSGWALEAGIDYFYNSGMATASGGIDPRAIESLFDKYKDQDENIIMADGIGKLCEDLEVAPEDIVTLVISWHMNAATMCEFTKEEFTQGLVKLNADSVDKIKKKLPELRAELRDPEKFRDIYNYAFNFAKEKGQKCLQLDTALAMWQLLFADERAWPLLDDWCEFLQKHHNRALSRDTWTQLFEFARTIKPDFSNFDENGAWPYLLDDFVDNMKEKRNNQ